MRKRALATDGVNEALYREPNPEDGGDAHTLDGAHPGWRLAGGRTGDLFVTHDPAERVLERARIGERTADHGEEVVARLRPAVVADE